MNPEDFSNAVAVIDDEPLIADMLNAILEPHQIPVHAYTSAEGALDCDYLANLRCIFLDLTLSDMQGLALVSAVVQVAPKVHLVIVSGHSREVLLSAKWHARLSGVRQCSVLQKPFTRDAVLQVLGLPQVP